MSEALSIYEDIEKYSNNALNMTVGQFESFMSEKYSKDTRTIKRRIKSYYEASAWAHNKEIETGQNHDYIKILAVGRKPRISNVFTSLTDEVKAFIENTLYDKLFAINRNPISNLYDDLKEKSKEKGWKLPSYDTVLRYVAYVKAQDGEGALALVSDGTRQWKNHHMMKRPRDSFDLDVLELVQTDCHVFDCFVKPKP